MLNRRWFRFSLRTLFIVMTAAAAAFCWFNWNLRRISERNSFLATEAGIAYVANDGWAKTFRVAGLIVGAEPIDVMLLGTGNFGPDDRARVQRLFPEARVDFIDMPKRTKQTTQQPPATFR